MAENNGTELAKAYVQIIPSLKGIKGSLGEEFGEEFGNKSGDKAGNAFVDTFKKIIVSAGIGKVIQEALSEGAKLEQSVGGVETLFKQSSDKVIKYAEKAYETAGLSANEYMENVTSFSATLLQGLGGDTEKAADIADMAMIDMSDNANKFGTEMQSIQDAYQGFAKQNYTMLDNLKLGYGGTKSEMERLLANAEKLSGHKYDISNFSDVINAIHDVQGNLEITGTTSNEAASTFSGSFASMKAAAKNLLGDMSTGMGDVKADVKNLSKTAKTFLFDNALPMLGNIVESIDDITDGLGPVKPLLMGVAAGLAAVKLADSFPKTLKNITSFSDALTLAKGKVGDLLTTLSANKLGIIAGGVLAVGTAVKMAVDKASDAIEVAVDNYDSLNGEQKKLVDSTEELSQKIADNAATRADSREELESEIGASRDMIDRLYELNDAEQLTNDQKSEMQSLVESLNESIPDLNLTLDEQTGHLQNQRSEVDKLMDSYEQEAKAAANQEILKDLYKDLYDASKKQNEVEEERISAKKTLADLQKQLNDKEKEYQRLYADVLKNSGINPETHPDIIKLREEMEGLNADISEQESVVGELSVKYTDMGAATRSVQEEIDGLSSEMSGITPITEKLGESFAPVGETFLNVASGIDTMTGSLAEARQAAYDTSEETLKQIEDIAAGYQDAYDAQYNAVYGSLDLFSKFQGGTAISAEDMISNLESNKEGVEEWSDNLKELAERGVSGGLIKELKEAGPNSASKVKAMTEMTDEQLDKYSDLWDETTKSCRDIVNEQMSGMYYDTAYQVSKMIGVPYGEKESMKNAFELLGEYGAQGFADGLASQSWLVHEAAANIGNLAKQAASSVLRISSPSRVFKEIGAYTAEGFALGIDSESKTAEKAARDMAEGALNSVDVDRRKLFEITSPADYDVNALIKTSAGHLQSDGYSEHDSGSLLNIPERWEFYLQLENGNALAAAVASPLDVINGRKIMLAERGHA